MKDVELRKVVASLRKLGFSERASGSHLHFVHPGGAQITLPNRGTISQSMIYAVARQVSGYGLADES